MQLFLQKTQKETYNKSVTKENLQGYFYVAALSPVLYNSHQYCKGCSELLDSLNKTKKEKALDSFHIIIKHFCSTEKAKRNVRHFE